MSADDLKAVVRRFHDAVNTGDLNAIDALCTPDFRVHHPPSPEPMDLETGKGLIAAFLAAFPDAHNEIAHQVSEGDAVVTRGMFRGTHTGEFMGMSPTGRQVAMTWISVDRFVGGRMAEKWVEQDNLGLMQQLGAIPAPATAQR